MSKQNKGMSFLERLDDEIMEDILNRPTDELIKELAGNGIDIHEKIDDIYDHIQYLAAQSGKEALKNARKTLNSPSTEVTHNFVSNIEDAKAKLVAMFQSGTLQNNSLTTAFRDGQDIPDEEYIDLVNELIALQKNNEQS